MTEYGEWKQDYELELTNLIIDIPSFAKGKTIVPVFYLLPLVWQIIFFQRRKYFHWEELAAFTRSLFNFAFKSNPYLERAVMTGITRISRESIFSDLNNLEVVTTTSGKYANCFGFTASWS